MATLQFGPANSIEGFTSLSTANFNDVPSARIVRELIQNSLDAGVAADEPITNVRFQVDKVSRQDIPDISGYRKSFESAIEFHTNNSSGDLPDAAQEVVSRTQIGLKALDEGEAQLLSIMDNGVGLDKKRMNSLLSDGASSKSVTESGSYGIGHLAPMALSDIRYMLYGGLTKDGKRIACGRTVLATHPHPREEKLNAAEGFLVRKINRGLDGNLYDFLNARSHPKIVTKYIDEIRSEWGHGCVMIIPVFNNFRNKRSNLWDIVSKVAAYNFCPAIHRGKLAIEVREENYSQKLDADSLLSILEQDQDRPRAARSSGLNMSGQNAYSILKTLTEGDGQRVEVNGSTAHISLLVRPPSGYSRIDVFRNGMWITNDIPRLRRTDFADLQPFHAVIEIRAKEGGELHRLIRKAEGPMHDKISFNLLSGPEESRLNESLKRIAEWIKGQVPPTGNDEYTVNDFLVVNASNHGEQGQESFSFWGTPTPMLPRRSRNQVSGGSENRHLDDEERRKQQRKQQRSRNERRSRPYPFWSVVSPDENGKLTGEISTDNGFQEIWLMLRVDENTDSTCDRIWKDENVTIKSFHIQTADDKGALIESEIAADGQFVKIRGISAETNYGVWVEYETSQELESVVETPVLRLELHVPPSPQAKKGEESSQDAA